MNPSNSKLKVAGPSTILAYMVDFQNTRAIYHAHV